MDEGHNLTRPNRLYQTQLDNLRKYVDTATDTIFVCCTGSMEADSSLDPRLLLDAVKGAEHRHLLDEGFLSSHHKRGASFPLQQPAPCADGIYSSQVQGQVTTYTELAGTSLVRYLYQAIKLQREGKGEETLANYHQHVCVLWHLKPASLQTDAPDQPRLTAQVWPCDFSSGGGCQQKGEEFGNDPPTDWLQSNACLDEGNG